MRKTDAVKHFGSEIDIARALNITKQAVNAWKSVIPWGSALELQHLTGGKLRRDESLYENRKPKANA